MLDKKNDTKSERIPQGNSASIQIYNDKATEAEKLPKQYGKMPFGITPHLTKLSAKALLLYVDMSQLFWGESNSLSLTTNPITDDGLAKRTGFSLTKTARARKELVDSGVVEVVKTAHADSGKLKRVFRFYQVGEMGEGKPQPEQTSDPQITNVTSGSPETASSDGAPEASNSQNRIGAIDRNGQHQLTEPVNPTLQNLSIQNQEKKSAKPDGDSVSAIEGPEPLLVLPTTEIPTTTTKADEWIEQQTYWSQKMGGTLAELHDHIKREFKLPDDYACRVMDALGNDKGGINYPQGYINHQDGIAHLAKIAQDVQQQIKSEQNQIEQERERAKQEEAEQKRKLELEQREAIFQSLGPEFDKDIQNTLKGVRMDSKVYYDYSGNEKPLESKIGTFLRNSEDIIRPIYDKHVKTSLDTDDVIEREKALEKRLSRMWDWDQSRTRLGDFCDFIKRMILSDVQLQSPFTLDDDTKPQPRRAKQQPTKPPASDKAKCYTPREKLTLVEGGQFNEGLKQELITQGLIELEADTIGTWASSMATSNMLAEAGMTSDELWRVVLSQAGDKPSESCDSGTNVSVLQDAPSEAEEDKPSAKLPEVNQDTLPQNCGSVSQQDGQNWSPSTMQDATAEAQLSLF